MTATTETPWCLLAVIDFKTGFAPYVVLIIHRNLREAQAYATALASDTYWPTTVDVLKYTDDIRKLKVGDYLRDKKIDVIMDKTGNVVIEGGYDED